jgi:hypothetical protein
MSFVFMYRIWDMVFKGIILGIISTCLGEGGAWFWVNSAWRKIALLFRVQGFGGTYTVHMIERMNYAGYIQALV